MGEKRSGRKKREGTSHIAPACVQSRPNKVTGGLYGRRAGTTLLADGFGPTFDASSRWSSFRCSRYAQTKVLFMETDPRTDGVAGCFEDEDLGVTPTRGGQRGSNRHLGRPPEARPNVLRSISLR